MIKNRKFNQLHILLWIFIISFCLPTIVIATQKLNMVAVRVNYNYDHPKYKPNKDTIIIMNNAMFHKVILDHYGKDRYYDILKGLKSNNARIRLGINIMYGQFSSSGLYMPQEHNQYLYTLMGDSTFVDTIANLLTNNLIFSHYIPRIKYTNDSTFIHALIVYDLAFLKDLSYRHNKDIDSLSKDEFLERQIHRIDSILTKTHLYYSRYDSDRIYDTDEYPLFTDSVTCMPPEYPSNLFHN